MECLRLLFLLLLLLQPLLVEGCHIVGCRPLICPADMGHGDRVPFSDNRYHHAAAKQVIFAAACARLGLWVYCVPQQATVVFPPGMLTAC